MSSAHVVLYSDESVCLLFLMITWCTARVVCADKSRAKDYLTVLCDCAITVGSNNNNVGCSETTRPFVISYFSELCNAVVMSTYLLTVFGWLWS